MFNMLIELQIFAISVNLLDKNYLNLIGKIKWKTSQWKFKEIQVIKNKQIKVQIKIKEIKGNKK